MKILGSMLVAALVIGAAQAVAQALALILIIGLIYGVLTEPKATFGLTGLVIAAGVVQAHPLACMGLLGLATVVCLLKA